VSTPATPRPFRPWTVLAAVALLAAFVALEVWWMHAHLLDAPPPWDQGLYLLQGLCYWHAWQDGGAPRLLHEIRRRPEPQPPLLPLSALPLYAAFSDARMSAYATSALYGALLLAATALLARRRSGDLGALLALALAATCSAPLLLSRDYQMDLPGAALLTAAVVAMERSGGFARRGSSLAAGALAGLMVLAKTMAAPFLVGPALVLLLRSWRTGDRRRVAANVLLASGVAIAVASIWWMPHLASVLHYLVFYGWGEGARPYDPTSGGSLLSLRNLGYYVVAFANEGASVPFFVIGLVLLAVEVRRRRGTPPSAVDGLLWTWLACGYALLTIARNKASDRYVIFLIPPAVVLMAGALSRPRAPWRRIGIAAALAAGAANLVGHTWPALGVRLLKWRPPLGLEAYTPSKTWLRTMSPIPEGEWPVGKVVAGLGAARVAYEDHLRAALTERALPQGPGDPEAQVRDAFRALLRREPDPVALRLALGGVRDGTRTLPRQVAALSASREAALRPLRVLVVPDHPYVNASTLGYRAEWARAPVTFARIEPGRPPPDLEDFDAVVVKTGIQGPDVSTTAVGLVQDRLGHSRFRLLPVRYPCPDGSEVRLYFLAAPSG